MNERKHLSAAFLWSLVGMLIALTSSGVVRAEDECPPLLRAAEVARHDFSSKLKGFPTETDFDKFVENIDNYNIGLSDAGEAFVVVFTLKKRKKGEVIKGGGAMYRIRKKDLAIISFVGQE